MSDAYSLHQFVVGAYQGDAVYNQAEILQKWLRSGGWESEIYAEHVQPELINHILPYTSYQPTASREVVILHYSIGSSMLQHLLSCDLRFIIIYHNITPPHFMASLNTQHRELLQMGIEMLPHFTGRTLLALADSEYSRRDLVHTGFLRTDVLPVPFNEETYRQPPDQSVIDQFSDDFINLLFVGRISPNKRIEDVIRVFYYYRQINSRSRLFVVGKPMSQPCPYHTWLLDLIQHLELTEVYLTGYVSLTALLAYYQLADVYVSMSEHEGYGVPLIESMYFDVPVLAYKAAAVPETLGQAGLQVAHKEFSLIAELIHQLIINSALRDQVISRQRQRLSEVSTDQIHLLFDAYVNQALSNT